MTKEQLELVDSLINDCNDAIKAIVSGQYVAWSNIMVGMVRKLATLRERETDNVRRDMAEN